MNTRNAEDAFYITMCVYIVMFIVTFGHFWVKSGPLPVGGFPPELLIVKTILSGMVSFLWPLYWSVQFWS